jgi:cyclopropane fatty-acyl-phospholipid synthase-like methyltransferase
VTSNALDIFRERYALPTAEINDVIEHAVIGAVWGANGYTTVRQADELGRRLALGPGTRLLDVGSGRGWPGLYLAKTTGCSVVCTDVPLPALQAAIRRAGAEALSERADVVAASASALPFVDRSFDAIVHTDVLC